MSNIIKLNDKRPPEKNFVSAALCMACSNTWFAVHSAKASLFGLECPRCQNHKSYASILPKDYLQEHKLVFRGPPPKEPK